VQELVKVLVLRASNCCRSPQDLNDDIKHFRCIQASTADAAAHAVQFKLYEEPTVEASSSSSSSSSSSAAAAAAAAAVSTTKRYVIESRPTIKASSSFSSSSLSTAVAAAATKFYEVESSTTLKATSSFLLELSQLLLLKMNVVIVDVVNNEARSKHIQ
jgi:hypothetical protein